VRLRIHVDRASSFNTIRIDVKVNRSNDLQAPVRIDRSRVMTTCDITDGVMTSGDTTATPAMPAGAPPPLAPAGASLTLGQALAARVRELLVDKGWSQQQLATRLGVTQGAVSHWLGGKRRVDSFGYYERLAEIFQLTLSELCRDLEVRVDASKRSRRPRRRPARAKKETIPVVQDPPVPPVPSPGEPDAARRASESSPAPAQQIHVVFVSCTHEQPEFHEWLRRHYGHLFDGTVTVVVPARARREGVAEDQTTQLTFSELLATNYRPAPVPPTPAPRRGRRSARQH
jgi:transcriptional regulator with XRE-family HTH domain